MICDWCHEIADYTDLRAVERIMHTRLDVWRVASSQRLCVPRRYMGGRWSRPAILAITGPYKRIIILQRAWLRSTASGLARRNTFLSWLLWESWQSLSLNRVTSAGSLQPMASLQITNQAIIQAAATYRTNQGTHVPFRASRHTLSTFRIIAPNPPTLSVDGVLSRPRSVASPFVTSTDGTNDMIVCAIAHGASQSGTSGYSADGFCAACSRRCQAKK